jgi:CDP-glycerol glycerophosphotransferase (TagB/SpsB family)/glycosyltransferase involved in cell wall biosynthesis
VRKVVRKVRKTAPVEWRAQVQRLPIDRDLVLYESFAGNGMLCNPEAIFRALLADPAQQHLRHVWVLSDLKRYASTVREFEGHPRVRFVARGSFSYHRALATAGLLFNNATFPPEFGKRDGQVYVNTWHGTPLKQMGYDEPDGPITSRNVLRNLMMADYLLSTSPFMSEQMYEQAYRLQNVYPGLIVEEGYPRTDRQVLDAAGRADIIRRLGDAGVPVRDGETVVLYAPTWRGESFHTPTNDAQLLGERVRRLAERLPSGHRVLLKVHQQVFEFAQHHPELRRVLVPNHLATNEVLGVTDVLVSDYSSIFFDFLATGRPIVFFTPDRAEYGTQRGFYLGLDDLPGPVVETIDELGRVVTAVGSGTEADPLVSHADRYAAARERFAPHDDGRATQRVLDVVVRGHNEGRRVRPVHRDGRKTMLIYLGGMKSNGITTSALNLLHHLDHDELDVSVLYNAPRGSEKRANARAIDPRVRSFPRVGTFAPSKTKRAKVRRLYTQGTAMDAGHFREVEELLAREWRRLVGSAHFDHIVDFSGYAPFWTFLLSTAPAGSHSVWLHNDLKADQLREVDGARPHYANLGAVFSSYARFQHLVSVSSALRDINAAKLAEYAPQEKFGSARNTINHELIERRAHGDRALLDAWPGDHVLTLADPTVPLTVEALIEAHDLPAMQEEIERRVALSLVPRRDDLTTFVTVGRLSPEKNHRRLLEAFDAVHQENPATRLVVIGGGPLMPSLERRAARLGLSEAVIFTGPQPNPWAIMAQCDCFVLSSDYEGQPMVILEARVLGLPVVSTAFDSVASALPPGVGLVVDRTPAALADGLKRAVAGEVPNPTFDPVAYNAEVMEEFYRAVGHHS